MEEIMGIENTSFKGSNGELVEGKTFHTKSKIDLKRGQGERAERFFMSKAKLDALDFTPAPGQIVEIFYNRFGKVSTLKLASDDNTIIDVG